MRYVDRRSIRITCSRRVSLYVKQPSLPLNDVGYESVQHPWQPFLQRLVLVELRSTGKDIPAERVDNICRAFKDVSRNE